MITTTPRLPGELIHLIVAHIETEHTLLVTALVCKSWLTFSRKTLFASITLLPVSATTFVHLLEAPSCTINSFIRYITFILSATELAEIIPAMTVKKLDAVTGLCLWATGVKGPIYEETLALILQSFGRITCLELYHNFRNFPSLLSFICSFPILKEVSIHSNWEGPATPCHGLQPAPTLHVLEVSSHFSDIIEALENSVTPPDITGLSISLRNVGELPAIARYLQRQGSKLEHFEWEIAVFGGNTSLILTSIDFGYNTGIRSLAIAFMEQFTSEDLGHFTTLFSTLTSPVLETVELRFPYQLASQSTFDWSGLDSVLANLPSNCLKAIRIQILSVPIEEAFSKCVKRGILADP